MSLCFSPNVLMFFPRPCPHEESTVHSSLREQAGDGEHQVRAWRYLASALADAVLLA